MKTCITCGMPFNGEHAGDIAAELPEGPVCKSDAPEGVLRSPQEIFEGGVEFFSEAATDGDRALAERLTRKNMHSLLYWQARPFAELDGPEATDEEFSAAMAKL